MLRRRALALARACESHAVTHARARAVQTSARTSAGMGPAVRATTAPVAEVRAMRFRVRASRARHEWWFRARQRRARDAFSRADAFERGRGA